MEAEIAHTIALDGLNEIPQNDQIELKFYMRLLFMGFTPYLKLQDYRIRKHFAAS